MKNVPEKIYLQVDADGETPEDFKQLDVTWCVDKINDTDIEYTLTPPSQPLGIEELKEIKAAFQWTWDNMSTPHTADHFNIPANGLTSLDAIIEAGYAASPQSSEEDYIEKTFCSRCHYGTEKGGYCYLSSWDLCKGDLFKSKNLLPDGEHADGIKLPQSSTSEEEKLWHEVKDMFFTNYANYNYPMQAINEIIKKYKISKR